MPEFIAEAIRGCRYSLSQGLPFEASSTLLRRAGLAAGASVDLPTNQTSMKAVGRANLGIEKLDYQGTAVLNKRTIVLNEYRIATILAQANLAQFNARIYTTGIRGVVFHLFQEFVPDDAAANLLPDALAVLTVGFSESITPLLADIVPSQASFYRPMADRRFVRDLATLTGDRESAVRDETQRILRGPWRVQHNDLHVSNIRIRENGDPVVIDLGSVAWNVAGADFFRLVPNGLRDRDRQERFYQTTEIAADQLGLSARDLRRAALLAASARHLRRARRHRNAKRMAQAVAIAAEALTLE